MTAPGSDVQAAVDAGLAAARPTQIAPEARYAVVVPRDGTLEVIDRAPDSELDFPRRKTGTTRVYDAESFLAVWNKQAYEASEVYADPIGYTVTGLFDADGSVEVDLGAGWRDHTVILESRKTVQWRAWESRDGQLFDQQTFAEFVEDRIIDFVTPTGAEMLELSQTFMATTKVDFKSANILSSSQRALVFEETIAAKAGTKGEIAIPASFEVGLTPFEGGAAYRVTARLRYRINNGHLTIGFKLDRPEDVLRTAFGDVRETITEAIGDRPVLLGHPPHPRS